MAGLSKIFLLIAISIFCSENCLAQSGTGECSDVLIRREAHNSSNVYTQQILYKKYLEDRSANLSKNSSQGGEISYGAIGFGLTNSSNRSSEESRRVEDVVFNSLTNSESRGSAVSYVDPYSVAAWQTCMTNIDALTAFFSNPSSDSVILEMRWHRSQDDKSPSYTKLKSKISLPSWAHLEAPSGASCWVPPSDDGPENGEITTKGCLVRISFDPGHEKQAMQAIIRTDRGEYKATLAPRLRMVRESRSEQLKTEFSMFRSGKGQVLPKSNIIVMPDDLQSVGWLYLPETLRYANANEKVGVIQPKFTHFCKDVSGEATGSTIMISMKMANESGDGHTLVCEVSFSISRFLVAFVPIEN